MSIRTIWLIRTISLLVICCIATLPAYAKPHALDDDSASITPEISGKLQIYDYPYFDSNPNSDVDNVIQSRAKLNGSLAFGDQLFFSSAEYIGRFSEADNRNDFALNEAYLDLRPFSTEDLSLVGDASLRLGQQIYAWGSGVMHNPTDNLSPWYAVEPVESFRRGVPGVTISLSVGDTTIDLAYITTFSPTVLPDIGERFFIHSPTTAVNPNFPAVGPEVLNLNYTAIDESLEPESDFSSSQLAARLITNISGWELALSYFDGYEHTAIYEGNVSSISPTTGVANVTVSYIYPEQRVYGADLSGFVGTLGIHVEGAYFDLKDTGRAVGVGDADYASVIAGFEYPINDFIGTQDLGLSIEYAFESENQEDERIYINRVHTNSTLLRLTHTYDYQISGELRYIRNFDRDDYYLNITYDYQYSDYVRFSLGADLFGGPTNSFYGAYDTNDRIISIVDLSF